MKYLVELTPSQRMALIDLITETLRCTCEAKVEEFVDCSVTPAIVTTPGQLLRLVSDAKAAGLGPTQAATPGPQRRRGLTGTD